MALTTQGTPLAGLSGLYADPQDTQDFMDEGVLEAKAFELHPSHGDYGSQALGYSGIDPTANPYSDFGIYDAGATGTYTGMGSPEPGTELDATPSSHCAPWPKGIQQPSWGNPSDYALYASEMNPQHGTDLGGPRTLLGFSPAGREAPINMGTDRYVSPDDVVQGREIGQLRGSTSAAGNGHGGGNADPMHGYGVVNTLEQFSHGVSIRYVQHDKLGFDYTNIHGEQDVPFYGRHPQGQAEFNGPDSPYYAMGSIDGGQIPWEGRIGEPTEYQQAPEPTVKPAPISSGQDVWASYGF